METQSPERRLPVQRRHCPVSGAGAFRTGFSFCGTNLGDSAFGLGACLVVDVLVGMKRKGIPVNAFGLLLVGYGIVVAVLGFAVTVPGMRFLCPMNPFG